MAAPVTTKALFTIVSSNYLPYARTLMASAREFAPEYERVVLLADELDPGIDAAAGDFQLLLSSALPIPKSRWFHFRYSILELNTALKPYAFEHLLESYDTVIYLDPDIALYSGLEGIDTVLAQHGIILTPHLLKSKPDDGRQPDDLTILRAGTYNLGFIGVRATPGTRRFLAWWRSKLYTHAYVDFEQGLFTDQRWIDMAPALFESVHICREPQYNVAYWNIDERQLTTHDGRYRVDGRPLCFFHFSGFDPENPMRFSKFQNRFTTGDLALLRPLLTGYADSLLAHGYKEFRNVPYAYGRFGNGSPVLDICRRYANESAGTIDRIDDPFSEAGFRAWVEYWNGYVWRTDQPQRRLTRLALHIYKSRQDLKIQMPEPFGTDYGELMEWFVTAGAQDYQLHPLVVNPVRMLLFSHRAGQIAGAGDPEPDVFQALASELPPSLRPAFARHVPEFRASGTLTRADLVEWLNERQPAGAGGSLTRMAHLIYESRPDLHGAFPKVLEGDVLGFLRWCVTAGAFELGLKQEFVSPLRRLLHEHAAVHVPLHRRMPMYLADAARYVLSATKPAPAKNQASTDPSAVDPAPVATHTRTTPIAVSRVAGNGINVIGYVRSETGMGEVSRSVIAAANAIAIPVSACDYEVNNAARQEDFTVATVQNEIRYSVNVCGVNADQTSALTGTLPDCVFRNRYNIGYWAWELEEFADEQISAFDHYDEVWTISSFCQDAISRKAPIPVIRIPLVVNPAETSGCGREHFHLPADEFLLLSIFDLRSVFRRKNPLGSIQAFRLALNRLPKSRLVLKANNAHQFPAEMEQLRAECAGLPVTIIDETISRAEVNDLIACSDCVVSLHRSEGFGLVLAEAMWLGKPVLATAYSGNLDFTRPDTAFVVNGQITEVGPDAGPYSPRSRWMEPDISAAAGMMATIRNDGDLRERIARRGQEYVRTNFSAAAVGKFIQDRLTVLRPRIERRISDQPHQ